MIPRKFKNYIDLLRNMGLRYAVFRVKHEALRRSGLWKRRFPPAPALRQYVSLAAWRSGSSSFFFKSKEEIAFQKTPRPELKAVYDDLCKGKFLLFNSITADLGTDYDWVTNPDSGFRYDARKHWTQIADYSKTAGDIKFVWEKSRFSYLCDIIRYDYHYGADCSGQVFGDIISWIDHNPVNCGPNYRCSQEMSLRVLNWTFALFYYRNSPSLTDAVFDKIQYAIYWHMDHVYKNIDFSRIAVRNNHAITETLTLYIAGLLYPQMPGAAMWKRNGKAWFEEEIAYQVYEDGTFLQFSMNYHRVVVQLLTWAIVLSEKNGERFADVVYDRALKSLKFLRTCMVDANGRLPNYGANDGALFFKLSGSHYRDYRPQLSALAAALGFDCGVGECEDVSWYGLATPKSSWAPPDGMHSFSLGGYYIIREPDTLTFIKCGGYKDRPSQADNLHLDVWYKGENVLIDAGSYKYNTDAATMRYFSGTESHNTVALLENKGIVDQMLKGGRFIWFYWSRQAKASLAEDEGQYVFDGRVNLFRQVGDDIFHHRKIVKKKGMPFWEITDDLEGVMKPFAQLWHYPPDYAGRVAIDALEVADDGNDRQQLTPQLNDGWFSSLYGQKEKSVQSAFWAESRVVVTTIRIS